MGEFENFGVEGAVDGVGAEEAGEEEDFGGEEEPDAQFAGVELLLGRVEVVGEEGGMVAVGVMAVVGGVVGIVVSVGGFQFRIRDEWSGSGRVLLPGCLGIGALVV